ncbi:Fc.00g026730.m01.CDS01 [Cosmosporella sp. VM-42]
MSPIQAEDLKVKLSGPSNWTSWKILFESKARALNIWEFINPAIANPPAMAKKPMLPAALVDEPSRPEKKPQACAIEISDRDQYDLWIYEIRERNYTQQQNDVAALRGWVEATVDISLRQINCLPHEELRTWFKNLKDAAGPVEMLAKGQATLAYRRFMTPSSRVPRDINKWVADFESMMMEAQSFKVPNATDAVCWYTELEQVTRPFLDHKLEIMRCWYADELKNNSLSFREVASQIRFAVSMDEFLWKGSRGIKRGAFPAIEDADDPTLNDEEAEPLDGKRSRSKRRNKSKKKPNHADESMPMRPSTTCKACGQFHSLTKCYYILPSRAPQWWKEKSAMRRTVDENLAKDKKLADEVSRLQKDKGSKDNSD